MLQRLVGPLVCAWGRQSGAVASSAEVALCVPPQLNLSRPIEEQGPLDVIIHKLTDVILEADQNDSQSLELVHRFQVSEAVATQLRGLQEAEEGPGMAGCPLGVSPTEVTVALARCGLRTGTSLRVRPRSSREECGD